MKLLIFASVTTACANRTGAAARESESLRRDCLGGLTSPAFHACGSVSPFCACTHSNLRSNLVGSAPLGPTASRGIIEGVAVLRSIVCVVLAEILNVSPLFTNKQPVKHTASLRVVVCQNWGALAATAACACVFVLAVSGTETESTQERYSCLVIGKGYLGQRCLMW